MATLPKNTKLVIVPDEIADTLKIIAWRREVGFQEFVENSLILAIQADELGVSLKETIDLYKLINIHMDSGSQLVSRSALNEVINEFSNTEAQALEKIMNNSGNLHGLYLKTRLDKETIYQYLEKDILLTWNLDDVIIERTDLEFTIKCIGFTMNELYTNLLVHYLSGLMEALDFRETDREQLRGLIKIRYLMRNP